MRKIIFHVLLRMLGRQHYKPLSKRAVNNLLFNLANEEGFERLPDFLQQCADQFRNQYLYTKDERFRGTVLAYTTLREQILEKKSTVPVENKNKKKKNSPKKESRGKIKPVY